MQLFSLNVLDKSVAISMPSISTHRDRRDGFRWINSSLQMTAAAAPSLVGLNKIVELVSIYSTEKGIIHVECIHVVHPRIKLIAVVMHFLLYSILLTLAYNKEPEKIFGHRPIFEIGIICIYFQFSLTVCKKRKPHLFA